MKTGDTCKNWTHFNGNVAAYVTETSIQVCVAKHGQIPGDCELS